MKAYIAYEYDDKNKEVRPIGLFRDLYTLTAAAQERVDGISASLEGEYGGPVTVEGSGDPAAGELPCYCVYKEFKKVCYVQTEEIELADPDPKAAYMFWVYEELDLTGVYVEVYSTLEGAEESFDELLPSPECPDRVVAEKQVGDVEPDLMSLECSGEDPFAAGVTRVSLGWL